MAQLPPDGDWLVQQIGTEIMLIHRYTEQVIVRYDAGTPDAAARAQKTIALNDELSVEQKAFAHFWCGYFYACNAHELI